MICVPGHTTAKLHLCSRFASRMSLVLQSRQIGKPTNMAAWQTCARHCTRRCLYGSHDNCVIQCMTITLTGCNIAYMCGCVCWCRMSVMLHIPQQLQQQCAYSMAAPAAASAASTCASKSYTSSSSSHSSNAQPAPQAHLVSRAEDQQPAQHSTAHQLSLENKLPHWNDALRVWCLNFNGRVSVGADVVSCQTARCCY
jgi:hypothetical protein